MSGANERRRRCPPWAFPPRLGPQVRERLRPSFFEMSRSPPWKAWYKTKRWLDLRERVFLRDLYRCQRSGVLCRGKHPAPNSPVANHKRAHRGDPKLFWDEDNVETVSKAVHDSIIQTEEQASLHQRGVWD